MQGLQASRSVERHTEVTGEWRAERRRLGVGVNLKASYCVMEKVSEVGRELQPLQNRPGS